MISTIKQADAITGGLGKPSKMPGFAYGIPAKYCPVGSKLVLISGSVCADCYALKGRYVFKNVQDAQERRYASLSDPQWVEAMAFSIRARGCEYFRWHDSGDIQGLWHLENIVEVALECPDTFFWVPTREQKVVNEFIRKYGEFPPNLVVRMSGATVDGYAPIQFFNTSTVLSKSNGPASCPAPQQGGMCGDCRNCWDPSVRNVSYAKH